MKRILTISSCIILAIVAVSFLIPKSNSKLEKELLDVAEVVVELQNDPTAITPELEYCSLLSTYLEDLKATDSEAFNLSQNVLKEEDAKESFGYMDDSDTTNTQDYVGERPSGDLENEFYTSDGTDKDVYADDNGDLWIKVNDIKRLEDGQYFVRIADTYYILRESDIPVTYKIMQNSPKYVYTLDRYEWAKDKSYLAVRYISVYDGSQMIVRVYTDGKQATKIEVR